VQGDPAGLAAVARGGALNLAGAAVSAAATLALTVLVTRQFSRPVAGAFFAALWPAVGLPSATEVEAIRGEVRSMREELRDAVADRDSRDDFASELHIAVRESIVNQKAVEKSRNGHPVALVEPGLAEPRKASVYQFSVWSGWPGEDPTEAGEDVGN